MKKYFVIVSTFLFSFFLTGCSIEDPATCNDGKLNQGETGIDCGGPCNPCFECLSIYCEMISGATSDQPRNNKIWEDEGRVKYTISSNGKFTEKWIPSPGMDVETSTGTWSFNDPADPMRWTIVYETQGPTTDTLCGPGCVITFSIIKLTSDTLQITDGMQSYYMTVQN